MLERGSQLVVELYDELRKLARARISRLPPGQTLQPTDLVHEVYARLVERQPSGWNGRRHFFGAAALAMRDIIVDHIRHKAAHKRGGDQVRVEFNVTLQARDAPLGADELIGLHHALELLQDSYPEEAEVVMLHCFAGLSMNEVAEVMGLPLRTTERRWRFARAWLRTNMDG
jgi:RNA polymerase sigma factor (TIGR02999 family)